MSVIFGEAISYTDVICGNKNSVMTETNKIEKNESQAFFFARQCVFVIHLLACRLSRLAFIWSCLNND